MRKFIYYSVSLVFLGLALFFGGLAFIEGYPIVESYMASEELKDIAFIDIDACQNNDSENDTILNPSNSDTSNATECGIDYYNRVMDFKTLKAINEDIVGWICIPGTSVDYPILIGDTNEKYLNKGYKGNNSKLGSIFAFSDTNRDLSDARTVLFGHNMRYGQMFGDLKNFLNKSYRLNHPKIYVYTEKKTMELDIFSVFTCKDSDEIFYDNTELGSLEYQELISSINDRCSFSDIKKSDIVDYYNNQSFSLSTCYGRAGTSDRLLVSGIVVREKYILG